MTILLQGAGTQTTVVTPVLPTPLLDLEADTLVLSNGDPVALWADQSGNGRDFTSTGTARPLKQTLTGYPAVVPDGINDYMLGSNFADNPGSFTVFCVVYCSNAASLGSPTVTKINNTGDGAGWSVYNIAGSIILQQAGGNDFIYQSSNSSVIDDHLHVCALEKISNTELHFYFDGTLDDGYPGGGTQTGSPVTNFSNSEAVRLWVEGDGGTYNGFGAAPLSAVRIYAPAPNSTIRAAIEAELATRYGITL